MLPGGGGPKPIKSVVSSKTAHVWGVSAAAMYKALKRKKTEQNMRRDVAVVGELRSLSSACVVVVVVQRVSLCRC